MCGIVGAVGKVKNYSKFVLDGLASLDYRGYDSAGVSFLNNNQEFACYKVVGTVDDLRKKVPNKVEASSAIGHTRWATHGQPTLNNAHPISSMRGLFNLVHNGVIENYRSLKKKLLEKGYTLKGETDTEIIANILEYIYLKNPHDVLIAIERLMKILKGSYALAILFKEEPNKLYFAKKDSPLIIAESEKASYLASDPLPLIKYSQKFIDVEDGEYGYLTKDVIRLLINGKEVEKKYTERNLQLLNKDLGGYSDYMLKEIEETPQVISRLLIKYFDGHNFTFDDYLLNELRNAEHITFLACGTSYHASLVGERYFRLLGKRSETFIASEWAYEPIFSNKNQVFILISQSGETADLIKCQKIINNRGMINIAITNTMASTLDREATFTLYLEAGLEVAVASTKAFSAQVTLLALLVSALFNNTSVIESLHSLNNVLLNIINRQEEIADLANEIYKYNLIFFIGRGSDYIAAKEASLKMKEITYIHSEAFPGGELKHGPIALVDNKTALLAFDSDAKTDLAIRNNAKEVETRRGHIYIISIKELAKEGDAFNVNFVSPNLSVIPMVYVSQYLAYYVAKNKKVNIDKPRNLAKSVTVE